MTNNSCIFYEQQKKAFFEHQFENLTPEELERMVGRYRPKSSVFPVPECIFTKRFRFLPNTLEVMQIQTKEEKKVLTLSKKVIKSVPKDSLTPKIEPKQRTKFGVFLESKSKSDTDSDNSFVIPNEFNDIITNVLRGNKPVNEKDLELIIETTPITKLELKELKKRTEWVDELVMSDCETSEKPNKNYTRLSYNQAQSPLIVASYKNSVRL
jgi:ribosomal protein L28